jgi:extradiol dioxygenase family protein
MCSATVKLSVGRKMDEVMNVDLLTHLLLLGYKLRKGISSSGLLDRNKVPVHHQS